ncbi:MAG: hypothetical protein ACFCUS_13920 [Rubrimonas sp.]|uniref:hypothetical protein n=1 Tax=Rubrimonas sp. TaxID=2036015 RepID=UPI002FDD3950
MGERTRQRVVGLLKIALPLGALALVAAIFLFPRADLGESIGFADLDFDLRDGLQVNAPRFSGRDRDGRPFAVSADWARPDRPDPERVTLGPVRGEMALEAQGLLTLEAGGGEMRPKTDRLLLSDGVALATSEGWRLRAASADLDLREAALSAEGPVRGEGPGGEIDAAKLRAEQGPDGYIVWFEGGVRVRIDPERARGEEQTP